MKKRDLALIILAGTSLLLLARQEIINRYFEKHVQLQVSFNKATTETVSGLTETVSGLAETVNHNAAVNNRARGIVTKDSSFVDIYNAINRDLN